MKNLALPLAALCLMALPNAASAQQTNYNEQDYAQAIAQSCLGGRWESQPCLSAISATSNTTLATYAAALQENGQAEAVQSLKDHCSATTAASRQEVPAYAMKSALTECANTISDVTNNTGAQPNLSMFQLMVAPIVCLDGKPECAQVEQQLAQYR